MCYCAGGGCILIKLLFFFFDNNSILLHLGKDRVHMFLCGTLCLPFSLLSVNRQCPSQQMVTPMDGTILGCPCVCVCVCVCVWHSLVGFIGPAAGRTVLDLCQTGVYPLARAGPSGYGPPTVSLLGDCN